MPQNNKKKKQKKKAMAKAAAAANSNRDASSSETPLIIEPSQTPIASQPILTPLSYGKLEETGIPEDYKPVDINFVAIDPLTHKALEGATARIATIPYQYYDAPDDPDGHTEWIVLGETKRKVFNYPGFCQRVPKPPYPTPNHVVRQSPGKGKGVFATRGLEMANLFSKRYTLEQFKQIQLDEAEKRLEMAVSRMSEERRDAYKSLWNAHTADGSGPLLGVMRTNGYGVSHLAGPDGADVTNITGYVAVANDGSRINHSCIPNVCQIFDVVSFTIQFFATKRIKVDEELFYCYCDKSDPVDLRQKTLAHYGFTCTCPACTDPTSFAPGLRRKQVASLERDVDAFLAKPPLESPMSSKAGEAQYQEGEDLLRRAEELYEELTNAGFCIAEALRVLFKLFVKLGKIDKSTDLALDAMRYAALEALLKDNDLHG
ncbi:hypothetical protein BDZ97DRAFT_1758577 [Flammula alnicola]|nr:hypothetical protein BDZ97DRAFT_1758577 [Flammula alnicola]